MVQAISSARRTLIRLMTVLAIHTSLPVFSHDHKTLIERSFAINTLFTPCSVQTFGASNLSSQSHASLVPACASFVEWIGPQTACGAQIDVAEDRVAMVHRCGLAPADTSDCLCGRREVMRIKGSRSGRAYTGGEQDVIYWKIWGFGHCGRSQLRCCHSPSCASIGEGIFHSLATYTLNIRLCNLLLTSLFARCLLLHQLILFAVSGVLDDEECRLDEAAANLRDAAQSFAISLVT